MNARILAWIAGATLLTAAAWFAWPRPDSEATRAPPVPATASPGAAPAAPAAPKPPSRASSAATELTARLPGSTETAHNPEGEARLRAHFEKEVSVIYEDVRAALGLNGEQNEALMALLVEQQLRRFAHQIPDAPESVASHNALEAQFAQELEGELGMDGARAFAAYRRTENARYEVEDLRRRLEAETAPLTEAQRRSLIRSAIERGAYVTFPALTGETYGMANYQEMYARFEQRDQKLLNVARGILDPKQMALTESAYATRQIRYDEMLRDAEKHGIR